MLLVREAMGKIEASKRAILMLRAVEQLSYEQIAEHMGVPVGTVMSRLNRARAALAEAMNAIEEQRKQQSMSMKFSEHAKRKQA
jgi:RNA polymerase sigma-70 factor (ECF subfamily)